MRHQPQSRAPTGRFEFSVFPAKNFGWDSSGRAGFVFQVLSASPMRFCTPLAPVFSANVKGRLDKNWSFRGVTVDL